MSTLVISDVHLRHEKVERIIAKIPHDDIVFLGDFFEWGGDTIEQNVECAKWLNHSLAQKNRIHLISNHDHVFITNNMAYACSSTTPEKVAAVRDVLDHSLLSTMMYWYFKDDIFFSHAGLTGRVLPRIGADWNSIREWLLFQREVFRLNPGDLDNVYTKIGRARGGTHEAGGLLWCHFWSEFSPIPGLNQIFGHTINQFPVNYYCNGNFNWALDTMNNHYILLEDGKVEIIDGNKI